MRLPLAVSLGNRSDDTDQDEKMVNAFAEASNDPAKEGVVRAVKRPGLDSAYETTEGTAQGLFTWTVPGPTGPSETLISITNDTITTSGSMTTLAKALRFVQQPTNTSISTSISPAVTVEAISKAGNRVTSFSSNIVVSLSTNPTSATLGGTLTQAASSGLATFNNLTLNHSGSDFKITAASSGLRSDTSDAFSVPTHLVFTTQPTNTLLGQTISSVVVKSEDNSNATDTHYNGSITLSVYSGSGTLAGTTTVTASSGIATFSNLSISTADTYTLLATAGDYSSAYTPSKAVSTSFVVAPYLLDAGQSGFATGYAQGLIGTLTPTTLFGATIYILDSSTGPSLTNLILVGETYSQDFFTSITVNGVTLLASAATFSVGGGVTGWQWSGTELFTDTVTYGVTIV